MKTTNRFLALVLLSMFVLATQALWGQPDYRFKIYATDGVYSDSVTVGLWHRTALRLCQGVSHCLVL